VGSDSLLADNLLGRIEKAITTEDTEDHGGKLTRTGFMNAFAGP
jgi:hypothetical protein